MKHTKAGLFMYTNKQRRRCFKAKFETKFSFKMWAQESYSLLPLFVVGTLSTPSEILHHRFQTKQTFVRQSVSCWIVLINCKRVAKVFYAPKLAFRRKHQQTFSLINYLSLCSEIAFYVNRDSGAGFIFTALKETTIGIITILGASSSRACYSL